MLTLANEFKINKKTVHFIFKNIDADSKKLVQKLGFNFFLIPENYSLTQEKIFIQSLIKDQKVFLVKDLYSLKLSWEKYFYKNSNIKLIVIDDFWNKDHICDFYINFSINNSNIVKKLLNSNCKILVGYKYALIQKNFNLLKRNSNRNKNIFIFFGSSDKKNLTTKFVKIFSDTEFLHYDKFVITTSKNKNLFNLKKLINDNQKFKSFNLIIDTDSIGKYLSKSFFAITSGGTISWEKLFFKIPSISIVTSKDQLEMIKELANHKKVYPVYDTNKLLNKNKILYIIKNRKFIFSFNNHVIDIKGSKRIFQEIVRYDKNSKF